MGFICTKKSANRYKIEFCVIYVCLYAFAVSELPLMKDSPSLNFSLNLFQSNCSY